MEIARIGIIGRPLGFSLSPYMYGELFKKVGREAEYNMFDIAEDDIEDTILWMEREGYAGFNVTMPYKKSVVSHLSLVDPSAEAVGAINVVRFDNGKRIGFNTDGGGFVRALSELPCDIRGKRIALIGAGGAATAIVFSLAEHSPQSIHIVNRNMDKAIQLVGRLNAFAGIEIAFAAECVPDADIIVNATPVGMYPDAGDALNGITIPHGAIVADAVYKPYKTPMIKRAEGEGHITMPGISMLFWQGVLSTERFLDCDMDITRAEADLVMNGMRERMEAMLK